MPTFVGRRAELALLEQVYEAERSAFIPIYGRRRVGKSELILRFLEGRNGVYYLGKQSPATLQVREFLTEAARVLDMPILAELRTEDWGQALRTVVQQWSMLKPGEKIVLALDEFQWIAGADPGVVSALQECWDRHWQRAGNVILLLCGSYIGFMERDVLGEKSPLFGRRTAQIHLQPFGYLEAAEFHPRWSVADRARAYFLVGGVPQYLLCLSDGKSIASNFKEQLLSEFAPLYHEPTFLLREELREVAPYHAILFALARGAGTTAEIAAAAGLPDRSLHYYLQQLTDLGYVRRRYPLDGNRPSPKQVRFAIDDPLLRAWFRFVFPNTSGIRSGGADTAYKERIAPSLEAYFGTCFERLCREALPLIYAHEGITAAAEVGEFWNAETQIDVVGLRNDNWTDLGECKWGTVRSPKALANELDHRARRYPNHRGATIGRRFFTRRKPSAAANDPRWHSLEDLYALQ
ncbi:MAG: ATP-binding protein [Gammaproteobacteria bacterium]|nr:ATP-binding protein [Gammaproteobacteria bacterium]